MAFFDWVKRRRWLLGFLAAVGLSAGSARPVMQHQPQQHVQRASAEHLLPIMLLNLHGDLAGIENLIEFRKVKQARKDSKTLLGKYVAAVKQVETYYKQRRIDEDAYQNMQKRFGYFYSEFEKSQKKLK